jgi:uncharacterized protein YhaN
LGETDTEAARLSAETAALDRRMADAPDAARPEARDTAKTALASNAATAAARVEAVQAELDTALARAPVDPDMLDARIRRLSDMAENRARDLADLRMQEAKIDAARRESFERRDPDAEVTRLGERAERLSEDVARHRRRADALSLLRDTLRESQATLRDRYTEPVRRELLPLLRMVIDDADVTLDESLGAQELLRGERSDDLDRLSGGTREQIAILTRLAFARMLGRQGQSCPVILDDALVYADDQRRGRMFDVMNYVSAGSDPLQLLYLSCHESSAAQLGGHRLRLETWPLDGPEE